MNAYNVNAKYIYGTVSQSGITRSFHRLSYAGGSIVSQVRVDTFQLLSCLFPDCTAMLIVYEGVEESDWLRVLLPCCDALFLPSPDLADSVV